MINRRMPGFVELIATDREEPFSEARCPKIVTEPLTPLRMASAWRGERWTKKDCRHIITWVTSISEEMEEKWENSAADVAFIMVVVAEESNLHDEASVVRQLSGVLYDQEPSAGMSLQRLGIK